MSTYVFGYIYCAVINCYPDYVKVGCTTDIFQRMNNLSGQFVDKFECVFFIKVEYSKMYQIENIIHKKIVSEGFPRINNKEFFKCKPDQIKYIFDNYKNYIKELDNNINANKKNNKINDNKINNNKIKSNENMLEYACKCCKYSTDIKCNYLKHTKTITHIENENRMLKCGNCNKIFLHEATYNNHINKHHKIESKITDPEIKLLLLEKENKNLLLEQEVKFLKEKTEILKENKEEILKSKEELSKYQDEHIEYLQQKNIEDYKISQLSSINYASMYYFTV